MTPSVFASLLLLTLIVGVVPANAQTTAPQATAPTDAPPMSAAVPPPPPPAAATTPATTTVTADTLLGFLQREAASGGVACALSTTYRVGERLAIACGAAGVWIAQIEPSGALSLVARVQLGPPITRLFEGGGRLWAELQGGAAVVIDVHAPQNIAANAPPQPTPSTPAAAPTTTPSSALPPLPGDNRPWAGGTTSTRAPEPTRGYWEVDTMVRPFLALETLGGGAVIDASVGHRFKAPVHLWAMLQPFAPATGRDGQMSPFVALALASYDTRNFEIGLGVGGQKVNTPSGLVDVDGQLVQPGTGITISQFARLGERDGLMVSIRSDIVLFREKFQLSNVFIHGQLPLRGEEAIWIIANGGGGTTGYALGEIGLRTRLKGDGGAGSVFLNVTVGGTSLFFETTRATEFGIETESTDYSGPLLGIGADWRL